MIISRFNDGFIFGYFKLSHKFQGVHIQANLKLKIYRSSFFGDSRCIFFAFIIPEIFSFLRSLKVVLVQTVHTPMPFDFFVVFVMETVHVTGVAILFYCALPYMDSVRAVMSLR